MSTRIKGCWVAFEQELREDDAENALNAILHVKGVLSVTTETASPEDWMIESRVRSDLQNRLFKVLPW